MVRLLLVLLFLSIHLTAQASSSLQTDWSGGADVPGPVTSWSNAFNSADNTNFQGSPGYLSLSWGALTNAVTEIDGSILYFTSVYSGDVDNDGDMDILVTSPIDNIVLWWENIDGASSWQPHPVASDIAGAFSAECADIDADGDNDIVTTAMGDNTVIWWENTDGAGNTWDEHIVDSALDGAKGLSTADLNNDGFIDIAASAKSADKVVCYLNNGSGSSWSKYIIADTLDCAMSAFPVDMDLDGDLDILSAGKLDSAIRWYENADGSATTWIEHSVEEDLYYPRHAYASDLDGDGDLDILAAGGKSKTSGIVCWWENTDGSTDNWTQHFIDDDFPGPFSILQCDVDQDGDMDAVSGSLTYSEIWWWENQNNASTWEKHLLGSFSAPGMVSSADLNSDGIIELFAGSLYSFNIHIWRTYGYHQNGSLVSSILDTGEDCEWNTLQWASNSPSGTATGVSMRSSWDENNLGSWSDTVYTSPVDLSSLINDNDRFVQYCVVMQSENCDTTPQLEQIEIAWNPLSIEEETFVNSLCVEEGNPIRGNFSLNCNLATNQLAELFMYDLTGRTVFQTGIVPMSEGNNIYSISNLSEGVYFAKLKLINGSFSKRVTVLH